MAIKPFRRKPLTQKDWQVLTAKQTIGRFRLLGIVIALILLAVVLRLLDLQVLHASFYQEKARKLRTHGSVLFHRGRILDRNGLVLAQDKILYDVFAHPRYFYKTPPSEIAPKLAPALGLTTAETLRKLTLPFETISLQKNITKRQAHQIQAMKLPGIETPRKMVRRYSQAHLASHVIGYVNDDASISTGVEKTAEKTLRTLPEMPDMERNGRGDWMNVEALDPKWVINVPQAEDVQLTIDARIQHVSEMALMEGLKQNKAKRGCVLVMAPRTGEILAFAVHPDFNPERFSKTPPASLKNWALTDVYPPGSTFKIITIASGLETGVIHRNSHFHDTGFIKMNGFKIMNYDYAQHGAPGDIDLVYLFQHSSNVGSLLVSLMMSPKEHHQVLRQFGMGQATKIDLPGESVGILHPPEKWDRLTHATIGFGYGLAATPVQMAAAISAIANDGVWVTPHILKNAPHVLKRRAISSKTAHTVTALLAESIETAKTSTVRLDGFRLAGKTGTSRKPNETGRGYSNQVFTSFVGYFPAEDPKVLIMVVVDSPGVGNAWGSTVAGPIFKSIADQIPLYIGLQPELKPQQPETPIKVINQQG